MDELKLGRTCRRRSRGNDVRRIQEWLSLQDLGLAVDGQFGAATEFAVKQFQKRRNLPVTGVVTADTFKVLVKPLAAVVTDGVAPGGVGLGEHIVAVARRHLASGPREIGGQNMGPWVRLYMNGHEGPAWPWCAGFACFVLDQACTDLGVPLPITPSVSCDSLAASAQAQGRFLRGTDRNLAQVAPGDFFLQRRTATDWTHVGIVVETSPDVMLTVEGNTNDEGSREGYEVCQRIRSFKDKDFIGMG